MLKQIETMQAASRHTVPVRHGHGGVPEAQVSPGLFLQQTCFAQGVTRVDVLVEFASRRDLCMILTAVRFSPIVASIRQILRRWENATLNPMDAKTTGVPLHFWKDSYRLVCLEVHRQFLRLSLQFVIFCIFLVTSLVIILRRLFARTRIRWYHSPSTIKLRLNNGKDVSLSRLCRSVTPPCFLNPLLSNRHLQTTWFLVEDRAFPLYFRRLIFESREPSYQGKFAVDMTTTPFTKSDPSLPPRTTFYSDEAFRHIGSEDSKPMLVVLHGLCGGSHEKYLQHVLAPLVTGSQKWEACVVLSRGCGQSSITESGMYTANATSDVRQVVQWLRVTFPNRSLYAAGFSMGANILTRYVAEEGEDCVFKAVVVVSNPWNLEVTALHLQRTLLGRWLYSPAMTANLMKMFSRNARNIKTIDGTPLDTATADHVHYMHEYDRHIQCPTWGFPTERVYYRQASSSDSVLDVRVPFWAINANDDPIVGYESIPKGEFQASPYTVLCTTDGGGHLGWFQSDGGRWYADAVVSFLNKIHAAC